MKSVFLSLLIVFISTCVAGQEVMTPEKLIQLNKVAGKGLTKDGKYLIYSQSSFSFETNSNTTTYYKIPIKGGQAHEVSDYK